MLCHRTSRKAPAGGTLHRFLRTPVQSLTLSLPKRQLNQRYAWTKAPFIAAQRSCPLSDLQSRVSGPLFSAQSVDLCELDLIDALENGEVGTDARIGDTLT